MFPFWESVIAPLIKASGARRIVEIGALRGETTTLLLDDLSPDAELHVIDPLPQFDPSEHERRFPGRYVFHRDISHAVLPDLGAVDVALIDGDHNWHTVHEELRMLAASSRDDGAMLPLMVMHDVGWPYGRRDLYYVPERIPEDQRQPYRQAGIKPGTDGLVGRGGINPSLANAEHEGGPRNGVMTALDDFMAEHPEPLRLVVLPIYFGLAIVTEQRRLEATPALAEQFDRLESPETRRELLELAESLRLRAVISEHTAVNDHRKTVEHLANRYLDSVRAGLLDEHHLENEIRLEYLAWCAANRRDPDPAALRDPAAPLADKLTRLERARAVGATPLDAVSVPFFPHTSMGRRGLDDLRARMRVIRGETIDGDILECGTGRGGGAIFMRAYLEAYAMDEPVVWVADEFRGADTLAADPAIATQLADINMVRRAFSRFDLLDERVRFLQGDPAESLRYAPIEKLALLRIDAARVPSAEAILDAVYDKLGIGGEVIVENCDGAAREALAAYRSGRAIEEAVAVEGERVSWRKLAGANSLPATESPDGVARTPLAPPLPSDPCELSIVVVFHQMRREAERTLQSLARGYQEGIDELDYEVIVVDNGSQADQRLSPDFVAAFGPEFKLLDLAEEATPSPAAALNRGIEIARGRSLGLMIDGAHVLTPGVLRHAVQGMRDYAPAMVATQQWYLGPGQQVETIGEGYDKELEDGLFDRIGWPADGYRLFEVGHFIGTRDWFDGMWESNCVFMPRSTLEQSGMLDEAFSMPGGGFANLDLFERIGATPGVRLVTLLGEGSFHQLHGGTTTNEADQELRASMIASYRSHYSDLRGRTFTSLGKPYHYVGTMTDPARRTRPRRMGAKAFYETAAELAADRPPEHPVPLGEDLENEFTDAYWYSQRWRGTSWMGKTVPHAPADLLAYQELIVQGRPRTIVETTHEEGGRAEFLASVCELLGEGEVVSIGAGAGEQAASPRIHLVEGEPNDPAVAARVSELAGEDPRVLLILGRASEDELLESFRLYSPLVPVGSWVVLEDTIVNGNPVWPGSGPGPAEAAGRIQRLNPGFVTDPQMSRLSPTFNPRGYLKRVS